jgi:hypothetical protein
MPVHKKTYLLGLLLSLLLQVTYAQNQDKEYLKEQSKDFKDIPAYLLRDAYPVLEKGFMNNFKISSSNGALKNIPAADSYKNILEVKTSKAFNNDWDVEMNVRNTQPVLEGDVLLLTFYMKTVSSGVPSGQGFTRIYFQQSSAPWEKVFNINITADSTWRKYQLAFVSTRDYNIGEGGLYFALAYSKQVIRFADIQLVDLGANVQASEIPVLNFLPPVVSFGSTSKGDPIRVDYKVNTNEDRRPISALIYGTNGQSEDADENITVRRLGGNRMTSYNWENNASNAGFDYMNNNDNYMLWKYKLLPYATTPAITMTAFHDTSLAMKTYTLMTAHMAGYVAADQMGPVDTADKAPSARWMEVKASKGSALSSFPNLTDKYVYMDEMINYIVKKYGKSTSATGIKGWGLDNEPALWNSTHPLIHPHQATCTELIGKSKALASVIKNIDQGAEVFGPMFFGYYDLYNFANPSDWPKLKKDYPNFLSLYLSEMKKASDSTGQRLLDVVAVHWYPESRGLNDRGVKERVWRQDVKGDGSSERGVAIARMQGVRTLWDSTYMEDSWYTNDLLHKPMKVIPDVQNWIAKYYPGTKLAFTEYNFGAANHISGGIAAADVLGVYGKYGVYLSTFWSPVKEYVSGAFKLYRNYDGQKSTFGDTWVRSSTSDVENSSIYSSIHQSDDSKLNLIILNKSYDSPINANIDISSTGNYKTAKIYSFDEKSYEIKYIGAVEVKDNRFTYVFPPLTASHIVFNK